MLSKPGKTLSTRVELRMPDPTCNPYLAFAVTLAAGMRGIEEGLELQAESTTEDAHLSEAEMARRGYTRLPRDLGEAVEHFCQSSFMREVLGDHIFDFLVDAKAAEWDEYCTTVTSWEREKYYAGF